LSSSAQPLENAKQQFYGTGRRKNAVARVFVKFGSGKISVNGRNVDEFFRNVTWRNRAVEPMKFTETAGSVDVVATVKGGGVGGQSGAVRMGLSRALAVFNPELRAGLRKNGFLTRDSRMKERKKYGQKGARKRFQYSKR
jgi:small subunit ribosomal protein S9